MSQVVFPVFKLGYNKPIIIDDVSCYIYSSNDNGDISYKIVDDKSIKQSTLSLRRLYLADKVALFALKQAIFSISDLLKLAKKGIWFIDSTGYIFTYTKTKFKYVTCHKILKTIPISTGCTIVILDNGSRYKTMQNVDNNVYAGVLELSPLESLFYGVSTTPFATFKRKV